ncbi:MAG TPA: hypothetical protein VMW43_03465 [Bacteroidota bacterium]|nr:hypothetical protein [Bacteroidota bacterium]
MARSKYAERFCGYCNKLTRMEFVGEMDGVPNKVWYRCARCHHTSLIDTGGQNSAAADTKPEASKATVYQPCNSFKVGEAIFHSEWNDVGKVVSKIKTSDGGQAIVVSFEKQGERRLIENLKPEPSADVPV